MKTLEPYMLEIFLCFHWALPTQAKGCSVRVQALGRGQQKMKTLETNSDIGTPSPISGPISGKVPRYRSSRSLNPNPKTLTLEP